MMGNPMMGNPMMGNPMMGMGAGTFMNPVMPRMGGFTPPLQMSPWMNPYMGSGTASPAMFASPPMNLGMAYGGYGGLGMAGRYGMGTNPYGSSGGAGSSPGGGGGYGMSANPYSSGGGDDPDSSPYASTAARGGRQSARGGVDLATVLAAYGVPNDGRQVSWPLAFRLMDPDEEQQMREPLEALLRLSATAAVQGRTLPAGLQSGGERAVGRLRRWLRDQEVGMAEGTYREAAGFLRQVERALRAMNSN
jgi:hypothetical protein